MKPSQVTGRILAAAVVMLLVYGCWQYLTRSLCLHDVHITFFGILAVLVLAVASIDLKLRGK